MGHRIRVEGGCGEMEGVLRGVSEVEAGEGGAELSQFEGATESFRRVGEDRR
jgi:hypothetical protein